MVTCLQSYLPLMSAISNHSTATLCLTKQPRPSIFQLALIILRFIAVTLDTTSLQSSYKQYLCLCLTSLKCFVFLSATCEVATDRPEQDSMTKTYLMMSERASVCSGSHLSVFLCVIICVTVLTHRTVCQAAIMPVVAASSRVIMSALLLPLFKDTLSLLLRRAIQLGRKIKGIQTQR